ncbi:MAG: dihydrofolate reductase [Bradymonadia bacterium]
MTDSSMSNRPVSMIAAVGNNWLIGREGELPWHLPADLKHFKQQTVETTVVMGRLTYESIGRPLPRRRNVVLSRRGFTADGVIVIDSVDEITREFKDERLMVIGGEQIYRYFLPMADELLLTVVDVDQEGDAFFPKLAASEWFIASAEHHQPDARNPVAYSFYRLCRSPGAACLPKMFPAVGLDAS